MNYIRRLEAIGFSIRDAQLLYQFLIQRLDILEEILTNKEIVFKAIN